MNKDIGSYVTLVPGSDVIIHNSTFYRDVRACHILTATTAPDVAEYVSVFLSLGSQLNVQALAGRLSVDRSLNNTISKLVSELLSMAASAVSFKQGKIRRFIQYGTYTIRVISCTRRVLFQNLPLDGSTDQQA